MRWPSFCTHIVDLVAYTDDPAVADEIGDVGIALLLLCERTGIDLLQAMSDKLARNRQRYPVEAARGKAERPER